MTPSEFEVRAFWTLTEALDMLPGERRAMKRWMRAANVVDKNAAGVSIVTRVRLESVMPEVLETMRRAVARGYHK